MEPPYPFYLMVYWNCSEVNKGFQRFRNTYNLNHEYIISEILQILGYEIEVNSMQFLNKLHALWKKFTKLPKRQASTRG